MAYYNLRFRGGLGVTAWLTVRGVEVNHTVNQLIVDLFLALFMDRFLLQIRKN